MTSRDYNVIPTTTGLRSEHTLAIRVGEAKTLRANFQKDMGGDQQFASVNSITAVTGTPGGVTIDPAKTSFANQYITFEPTGVTIGVYTLRIDATYDDGSKTIADLLLHVVE